MKKLYLKLVLTLILITGIQPTLMAQSCVTAENIRESYDSIYFVDDRGLKFTKIQGSTIPFIDNSDFSIGFWLKPNIDNGITLFSAGIPKSGENTLSIRFVPNTSGDSLIIWNWKNKYSIGISASDWKNNWTHFLLTYSQSQSEFKVFLNGSLCHTFTLMLKSLKNSSGNEDIYIGDNNSHLSDYRGYLASFRFWNNKCLSNSEVSHVWDKTFKRDKKTFKNDMEYLSDYLLINLYSNRWEYNDSISLSEIDTRTYKTDDKYPARPIKPYNIQKTVSLNSIELSWECDPSTTTLVRKRKKGDSNWEPCRVNGNSYIDNNFNKSETIDEYEYELSSIWKDGNSQIIASDTCLITGKLLQYEKPSISVKLGSTTTPSCNGTVVLKWGEVACNTNSNLTAEKYTIQYREKNTVTWNTITDQFSQPGSPKEYEHLNIPVEKYGKELEYKVCASDKVYQIYSDIVTATANKTCTAIPENIAATVNGNNIDITWDYSPSGPPATEFIIRRTDNSTSITKDFIADKSERSYTDNEAGMCAEYFYQIRTKNNCGQSDFSTNSNTVIIEGSMNNVFSENNAYFRASTGYFNQKVLLEWNANPDKLSDVNIYEIYRRKPGLPFSLLTSIDNSNTTSFEDFTTEANTMYQYKIRAKGSCVDSELISDSTLTNGFSTKFGIVTGNISYSGGNAVKDVEVRLNTTSPTQSSSVQVNQNAYAISHDFQNDSIFYKPLSIEAWFKFNNTDSYQQIITFQNATVALGISHFKPSIYIPIDGFGTTNGRVAHAVSDTSHLKINEWYHIASTIDPLNGCVHLYLNGDLVDSTTFDAQIPWISESHLNRINNETLYVSIGRLINNGITSQKLNGNIDDLRIWQKVRSKEEIKRDYTRLLSGEEDNLIGYYQMDENFGDAFYDISKTENKYNRNQFQIVDNSGNPNEGCWSLSIPSYEQLHPAGVTDKNGNYIIKGIKYTGIGSVFNITPVLGVHEFSPASTPLYIGDKEPVHNNINFTDKSSFSFSATVYYEGTNFPVKGADVYIDNQRQFNAGGKPIQTDDAGIFKIHVPIGEHFISVKKNNHVFVDNGQWPVPTETAPYKTFNFQDDVYGIEFNDLTRVIVAGRFVGGDVEGNKKLGVGKSKANIGSGIIVFKNEQGYDIDTSISENSFIKINTDSITGEYEALLLPEEYKIESVSNASYSINSDNLGLLNLSNFPVAYTNISDTTVSKTDTIINHYQYHVKRNFIYYNQPEIFLYGENDKELTGDKEYYYINKKTNVKDTIDLVNGSPFQFQVFTMGRTYDIGIRILSTYINPDTKITDTVSVKGAEVTITNNLEMFEPTYTFFTDSMGYVNNYTTFKVGTPNINTDNNNTSFTKQLNIDAKTNGFKINYNGKSGFRGYVLGCADAEGANFVSYGVERPQFILRDPPGDGSYTTLEEGSSYSVVRNYSFTDGTSSEYENELDLGVDFSFGGGLMGPVVKVEEDNNISLGINKTTSMSKDGEYTQTYSFTKSFSTSSDPDGVGSMADVYIGESTNLFFTEVKKLKIYPKSEFDSLYIENKELADSSGSYTIGIKEGNAITGDTTSTFFIYSQSHILNTLIPAYRKAIRILLSNSSKYDSNLPSEHIYFGLPNDAAVFSDAYQSNPDTLPSYKFTGSGKSADFDSIAFLNEQISLWCNVIAFNEKAKMKNTSSFAFVDNVSFDGNIGEYSNSMEQSWSTSKNNTHNMNFSLYIGSELGAKLGGVGFTISSKNAYEYDYNVSEGNSKEHSMTWSYVLDDSNPEDYYSVDILHNNHSLVNAKKEDFLNLDNHEKLTDLMIADGVTSAASQLYNTFAPVAGQLLGMAQSITIASIYSGFMYHYSDEIDESELEFGAEATSPIFRIRGGQSRCPHEGEEYAIFTLNEGSQEPGLLTIGSQAHEKPQIAIEPYSVTNVPEGTPATFTLKLMNESPTDMDLTYSLYVDESSNSEGAIIKVDGLNPNRPFHIPAGETVIKTLTVEKGSSGLMDYKDLRIVLSSECQDDYSDTATFTASFIPVCSTVNFSNIQDNWIINKNDSDKHEIVVDGYDVNSPTLQKITFSYQQAGTTPTSALVLYHDTLNTNWVSFTGNKMYINNQPTTSFNWNVSNLNDGEYSLYLTSMCSDKSTSKSGHIQGVIDRITPRPFGTPEPGNGILSVGEDISIEFNESINSGKLYNFGQYGTKSDISVRGITNGTDMIGIPYLLHDASVRFDGQSNYMKADNINLDHTNFTIEFWAKRDRTGRENLITIGNSNQTSLWIGFDKDNYLTIKTDEDSIKSEESYSTTNDWAFYSIAYNKGDSTTAPLITQQILSGASGSPQVENFEINSTLEGIMHIAYCPKDASAFKGNIHELRIWNYERHVDEITAQKGQVLNGYEKGLYRLWPMNEANGKIAKDIAFGSDAQLNASWQVSRNGKAVQFDGSNCFAIPASQMIFSNQSDFTVEFWYKTAKPNATIGLMSNGIYDHNINAWNIQANQNQELIISNNNSNIIIDAKQYLDNNWHHFALSLSRIGYASVFLDGNLVKTAPASQFEGLAASKLVFAANWNYFPPNETYNHFMTGGMDEIRLWNTARTQDQIKRYMNHTLTGDEFGLKGYFPFEDVTISDPSISNETAANFTKETQGIAGDTIISLEYFTSKSPKMKLQRPEVLIPHQLVINEDKVIITPDIEAFKIENQILDISIKNVEDMNNNKMESSVTWTAFVDKNAVVWDKTSFSITKPIDADTSLWVNIINKGGLKENYQITNIPSWMEVSPESGSLSPLESNEVEIRIKPEVNIGRYQREINLVSSLGYSEKLSLNINIKGHIPGWEVEENYRYSANLIGQLSINEIISTDEEDIVACFVNNQCRGIANIEYLEAGNLYLTFIDIYSNDSIGGEKLTFKVYDASTGEIYTEVSPDTIFNKNQLYGSISEPYPIHSTNSIEQPMHLKSGWNWKSFYVKSDDFDDPNEFLSDMKPQLGDEIKNPPLYIHYTSKGWDGSLNTFSNSDFYNFKVTTEQSFSINGKKVKANSDTITIVEGWNWIGYPHREQTKVNEAMASVNPENGDLLKSQQSFAIYDNTLGWIGSLKFMSPGEGYMLKSGKNGELIYNPNTVFSKKSNKQNFISSYNYNPNLYPNNMTIIAEVITEELIISDNDIVYAFINNECRGFGKASVINGKMYFFITVNGVHSSNIVNFVLQQGEDIYEVSNNIEFKPDDQFGSIENPQFLNLLTNTTSVFDHESKEVICEAYPNPFTSEVNFIFTELPGENTEIKIYNSIGIQVAFISNIQTNSVQWNGLGKDKQSLPNGIYHVIIRSGNQNQTIKICKTL